MKKNKTKNEKGITLVVLIITIILLAILSVVTIRNVDIGSDIRDYNYMCADIELLNSKIMAYYNEKGTIPTKGTAFNAKTILGEQASNKDNDNYYQIDINSLVNVTLNYGGGTIENGDIYIMNEQSHEVYYLKGAKSEHALYHKHM